MQRAKEEEERKMKGGIGRPADRGPLRPLQLPAPVQEDLRDQTFYVVKCTDIKYHKDCWRAVTRDYQKADLDYGAPCLTPCCDGTITSIVLMATPTKVLGCLPVVSPTRSRPGLDAAAEVE